MIFQTEIWIVVHNKRLQLRLEARELSNEKTKVSQSFNAELKEWRLCVDSSFQCSGAIINGMRDIHWINLQSIVKVTQIYSSHLEWTSERKWQNQALSSMNSLIYCIFIKITAWTSPQILMSASHEKAWVLQKHFMYVTCYLCIKNNFNSGQLKVISCNLFKKRPNFTA